MIHRFYYASQPQATSSQPQTLSSHTIVPSRSAQIVPIIPDHFESLPEPAESYPKCPNPGKAAQDDQSPEIGNPKEPHATVPQQVGYTAAAVVVPLPLGPLVLRLLVPIIMKTPAHHQPSRIETVRRDFHGSVTSYLCSTWQSTQDRSGSHFAETERSYEGHLQSTWPRFRSRHSAIRRIYEGRWCGACAGHRLCLDCYCHSKRQTESWTATDRRTDPKSDSSQSNCLSLGPQAKKRRRRQLSELMSIMRAFVLGFTEGKLH